MTDYQTVYWDKLAAGSLWLQFCPACGQYVFYPRQHCPFCWNSGLDWRQVSGEGHLYSYSIVYVSALPEFKDQVPYIYALVELSEGIRLTANLIECPLDQLKVGLPVKLALVKKDGKTLPLFKLA